MAKKYIYPHNVHKAVSHSSKLTPQEKSGFIIGVSVILVVASFIAVEMLFTSMFNFSFGFVALFYLVFLLIVGSTILRYAVFHEEEMAREYKNSSNFSFSRYYKIRKESEKLVKVKHLELPVYEYVDGTSVFAIRLRFGSNNTVKCKATRDMFARLYRYLLELNFTFHSVDIPEDFEDTDEYRKMVAITKTIQCDKLREHYIKNLSSVIDYSKEHSNCLCSNLIVTANSFLEPVEFASILSSIIKIISTDGIAIRSLEFLNLNGISKLIVDTYGLEALDLSLIKSVSASEEDISEYLDLIKLYMVETTDGIVYSDESLLDEYIQTPINKR